MQNRNPYAAPSTNVARSDEAEEYGEIKVLSARGRLGRVRYIGYSIAVTLVFAMVLGAAAALAGPDAAFPVTVAGYVAIVVVSILLTIQRAHDMNWSGWAAILMIVPLVNLLFWFVPGTAGENHYGKRPPPNTTGAILLACIMPAMFVLGIVAAIAIPAYQDYAQRAAEAQLER